MGAKGFDLQNARMQSIESRKTRFAWKAVVVPLKMSYEGLIAMLPWILAFSLSIAPIQESDLIRSVAFDSFAGFYQGRATDYRPDRQAISILESRRCSRLHGRFLEVSAPGLYHRQRRPVWLD